MLSPSGTRHVPIRRHRSHCTVLGGMPLLFLVSCGTGSATPKPAMAKTDAAISSAESGPSAPVCAAAPNPCSDEVLSVHWEPDLPSALQRAQAEHKPVLIAFSARRQEAGFEDEF